MTKVLYYTKINFANQGNSGIIKKVFSQVKAFNQLGLECDLFYFQNNECVLQYANGERKVWHFDTTWQRIRFQYFGYLNQIDFGQYKATYIRHFFLHPLALMMLKRWKKQSPNLKVMMEIASYPYHKQARKDSFKEQLTYKLDAMLTPQLKKNVDKILTFSPFEQIFGIPTLRTSNGIDTDDTKIVARPQYDHKQLNILGLANVQHWHGFDRVIAGLADYYSHKSATSPTVIFNIVGKGDEIPKLQQMVANTPILKEYVVFHGAKYGDELERFFDKTHIAVSSLGMHRIGVANGETSNLKVREYCAKGIPFINGYLDRDIPADFEYVFQVPADETAVPINEVIDFYQKLYLKEHNYPQLLHDFAVNNLTWKAKLAAVAAYLK